MHIILGTVSCCTWLCANGRSRDSHGDAKDTAETETQENKETPRHKRLRDRSTEC